MSINSDRLSKPKIADHVPTRTVEASDQSQIEQSGSFWNTLQTSFSQVYVQDRLKRAIEKARANIQEAEAKLTPLERMNRRYPNMKLHSLPETFPLRDLLGEPDVDVCLQYYRRFMAASESEGDEPVSILLKFLKEHPIEFGCSGWILYAVGYIVLGYPDLRNCHVRAKKLFSHYWRDIKSPKHKKRGQQIMRKFKACRELDSPHVAHWKVVVKWMNKAAERGVAGTRWFDDYSRTHPNKCVCLSEGTFQVLRKAYVRVVRHFVGFPPPSAVVLEAVATKHAVSARALAEFRADAGKRTRNSQ